MSQTGTDQNAVQSQSAKERKILGQSVAVSNLINLIKKVAVTKTNVLVIGESGTGKELVARMIHEQSPMKDKSFVAINCGAIPENLIESELFGHAKGSFTGAVKDKAGLFEVATGGTLFLDEIGELPLSMQVKLLRALQEKTIRRVGANEDIKVDARVVAATNRDLEAAIAKGTFREDLYYRLNVILIKTPPLRDRTEDLELLTDHFIQQFANRQKRTALKVSDRIRYLFKNYPWPGNIRELENVIERLVTLATGDEVSDANLPVAFLPYIKDLDSKGMKVSTTSVGNVLSVSSSSDQSRLDAKSHDEALDFTGLKLPAPDFQNGPIQLDEILTRVEAYYLNKALTHTGGLKKKAAGLLGITFRSIRYRLEKLGISVDSDDQDE